MNDLKTFLIYTRFCFQQKVFAAFLFCHYTVKVIVLLQVFIVLLLELSIYAFQHFINAIVFLYKACTILRNANYCKYALFIYFNQEFIFLTIYMHYPWAKNCK